MKAALETRSGGPLLIGLVIILLAGLPLAVYFDLRALSESALRRQASDLDIVITGIRGFYSTDVVGRVLAAHGSTTVTSRYHDVPGGIPIPATFSLALGHVVGDRQHNIEYRFVSDYPFKHRAPHVLDAFERRALAALRAQPKQTLTDVSWTGLSDRVRFIAPVIMGPTCVGCHNTNPDSPKRDWKVGDVRGIQELAITQPLATNLWSFKYLLGYFAFAGALGFGFIALQRSQAETIRRINAQLSTTIEFLSKVSTTISHYLSPQIYKSIFAGQSDGSIRTERKKLTIFFSDIKDFTSTAERLQPEELTALLNEYFTEMSKIALAHGGTVDKFIGDAMLVFFGDPESNGVTEDARACVRMAAEMQRRLVELSAGWRRRGVEEPFRVRMGINTGYCNVGNFGSEDRMDYTIIGAEANLSARLQAAAEPGSIVISYETYALVRDLVTAHPLPAIRMKGISRDVVPYVLDGVAADAEASRPVFSQHGRGVDLYIDPGSVDAAERERLRRVLSDALQALDARDGDGAVSRRTSRSDP